MTLAPKAARNIPKATASLLPMDILLKYLVPAYEEGVLKYERESWRRGFHVSELIDSTQRHITAFFYEGEDYDPDAKVKKHHLAGAVFSLLSILHTLEHHPELDDRRQQSTGTTKPQDQESTNVHSRVHPTIRPMPFDNNDRDRLPRDKRSPEGDAPRWLRGPGNGQDVKGGGALS